MRKVLFFITVFCVCVFAKKNAEITAVTTSIPALAALVKEILKDTPIEIIEPFGNEISIDELDQVAKDYEARLDEISKKTAAVADIRSVIAADPLFVQMRHRNIKIVEIDCATPLSPILTAVGKIRKEDGSLNPFVWLSLSNSIRMAEVLQNDFCALFPKYAKKINANLIEFKKNANDLRNSYVRRFLDIDNFSAVCLSDDFDYMLKDIDLFVVGKFPPEYEWNEEITTNFEKLLENKQIGTVISRWAAGSPASEIMTKFGVKVSVLRTGFPAGNDFENGFLAFWAKNAEAVLKAMTETENGK
jgi:ABC-type Zn uptake system ZnuABC Zn-binding protein ZnuA